MSVEFRAAFTAFEKQMVQEKGRAFAGDTSLEAARLCVRMLDGILDS